MADWNPPSQRSFPRASCLPSLPMFHSGRLTLPHSKMASSQPAWEPFGGKMRASSLWTPNSSCHSQLSCRCLGTDPCVQFENHRPSNLSALLFADGLFLSLLVSLKAKRDSAHKEVSHPSGSLHTLTQSPFWGFWGQMKLDPIWKCGLHNLWWFSDNQNASLFLLSVPTFYQVGHGTVKNFQRYLACLRILQSLWWLINVLIN